MAKSLPVFLLLGLASLNCQATEIVELPSADGGTVTLEITLPPDFDPAVRYSILVSPGEYYWQDRPSQPGWIVVVSDAFRGEHRLVDSKTALEWLREQYLVRNGAFHIAGWSANSVGVFEIAMTHSTEFLSVTGIAGMPGSGAESQIPNLDRMRVQFIVGENDPYWRQGSERWFEKMKASGIHATLEIIPGGGHVMAELANEPLFERLNRLVAEIESGHE